MNFINNEYRARLHHFINHLLHLRDRLWRPRWPLGRTDYAARLAAHLVGVTSRQQLAKPAYPAAAGRLHLPKRLWLRRLDQHQLLAALARRLAADGHNPASVGPGHHPASNTLQFLNLATRHSNLSDHVHRYHPRSKRAETISQPALDILSNVDRITAEFAERLCKEIGMQPYEEVRVLYLTEDYQPIVEETLRHGTIDTVPLVPRDICSRALELAAEIFVIAHNHPSGDASPSHGDIRTTQALVNAITPVGFTLHDHLVISDTHWSSMRALGILPQPAL
jgi:hypothetical protein